MKTPGLFPPCPHGLALLGLCCAGFALPVQAGLRSSSAYTQPAESLDSAGRHTASTAYAAEGELGTIGAPLASAAYTVAGGFSGATLDLTVPTLTLPASLVLQEATGPDGATVTFSLAATDDEDGALTATAMPASGTVFALGDTTVTVTVSDASGNIATGSFQVRVQDTTAPVVTLPADFTIHATSTSGAVATYAATATDAVGVVSRTYSRLSGTVFPNGTTTVTATATDAASNTGTASFHITVTPLTIRENWRYANFGTADNTGNAADGADPDHDGLTNLLEFAFGTDPALGSSGPPALVYNGTFAGQGMLASAGSPAVALENSTYGVDYRALYVRRTDYAAAGLAYSVEFSPDLVAWQANPATPAVLADDGSLQVVSVPYPLFVNGRKARFFHVLVTAP